ncbi:MAG TPA: acyl-CoA dehydrogenase family protein [Gemmatimonadales bacterium]|nr:acyl-CoA dehydrogenase family protein [Gemmatimonadales bacterium]
MRPDIEPVAAFLEPRHAEVAAAVSAFGQAQLAGSPDPDTDAEARRRARALVPLLAAAGLYEAVERLDLRAVSLIREGLAWHSPLADEVYALQALGSMPIRLGGSAALQAKWLPAIDNGEAMCGFAMTEPEAGSDVGAMTTRATKDGEHWVLEGRKAFISNAGIADVYAVFATTDPSKGAKGISAFLVPADAPGLVFAGAQVMSAPHPLGELSFERCRITADHILGEPGRGLGLGLATLDRLRATVGAAACGMAARALDEAVAHVKGRKQFGKPLAEFQLTQGRIGEMATELAAARLLVYRAVWAKDRGAERVTLESAMAKSFATEAAQRIVDGAVQLLGGRGVVASHPVDRLYRAVRALRIYEGTTEIQRLLIAREVLGGA